MKFFDQKEIKQYWGNADFVLAFIKSSAVLALVLVINYFAVRHATSLAGPPISDAVLDRFAPYDTSFVDYYVALYVQYATFLFALTQPRRLLLFIDATSLLILVRGFFVNLTHLGVPAGITPTMSFFTQGGDLFFSGHTALPFLAALVFWDIRIARYIFLFLAMFMGIEVLLGHQHYSIDVFAAPFITYGVFTIAHRILRKRDTIFA